ncbi:MAG TPA: tetratricopeptide repeat protein, partial [Polyangiaceae bacterium]
MAGSQNRQRWLWLVSVVVVMSLLVLWPSSARARSELHVPRNESAALAELQTAPGQAQLPPAQLGPDGDDVDSEEDLAPARVQRRHTGLSESFMGGMFSRYGYAILMALAYFYFTSRDSRGSGFARGPSTYYLFWLVGPALLAIFLEHPAFLGIVALGVVARPWLPDPLLYLRYMARTRRLEGEIRVNRANVTARRDLSLIWLEKRRAKRALPLLEEALAQDASSLQLLQLRGVCLLQLRRYEEAVQCFIDVVQRDPRHGFGEPYLRAADALIALKRWDDAEDALEHFIVENRSSVEGLYKRALVA